MDIFFLTYIVVIATVYLLIYFIYSMFSFKSRVASSVSTETAPEGPVADI